MGGWGGRWAARGCCTRTRERVGGLTARRVNIRKKRGRAITKRGEERKRTETRHGIE